MIYAHVQNFVSISLFCRSLVEKPPNFAVFWTSAFSGVTSWRQSEKVQHCCTTTNIPVSNSIKINSVLQRLHAKIGRTSWRSKAWRTDRQNINILGCPGGEWNPSPTKLDVSVSWSLTSLQHKHGHIRDGLSQFIEDTGEPSVSVREFDLLACQKPDKPAVGLKHTIPHLPASHCTAARATRTGHTKLDMVIQDLEHVLVPPKLLQDQCTVSALGALKIRGNLTPWT